ncbi:MAG TPA: IclR family transcriptional regulator [Solirubrobacteraceae bacterium]|nr:IclR family transcriptional regulator [Solirubrobacteraceae bacterium]
MSPKMGSRSGARLTEPRYSQSLETGLLVMKGFSSQTPLQGIADVADRMEASRSTVHRYMTTLVALGMLEQDSLSRRYRVSLLPADIGAAALDASRVVQALDGQLVKLRRKTGYTVRLGVLVDRDVLLAGVARSVAEGQGLLGVQLRRGASLPAHATALGKVLLGGLDAKLLREMLASTALAKLTPKTITSKRAFTTEVAEAKEQGFALEQEEAEQGTVSVAVPVFDSDGDQVAALGLVGHLPEVSIKELQSSLVALKDAADAIGQRVGERETRRRSRRRAVAQAES